MTGFGSNSRYGPLDVAVYLLGVALLAACLTLVFLAMRAVMDVGGFCAEGGPYQIETHCPEGVALLLPLAIFGGLGAAGLMAWKGAQIGGGYGALVALAWPALFISLGWNFLEYALFPPPPDTGIVLGWLIPGVIFVIMGAGPLLALLPSRRSGLGGAGGLSGFGSMMGTGGTDSSAGLRTARKRLLSDLAATANKRGWGAQDDVVTQLERLAALRNAGAISAEEFDQAKRAVLGGAGS